MPVLQECYQDKTPQDTHFEIDDVQGKRDLHYLTKHYYYCYYSI